MSRNANCSAPGADSTPRILIVRLSAIGDVVMASGLIPAVRRRWPQAHLTWLVEPSASELLRCNPALDDVIVWPKHQWRALWQQRRLLALAGNVRRMRRELRQRRFDLVLDAQGIMKSGLLSWLTGAPRRLGLDSKEGSRWLMHRVIESPRADSRLGGEYRHLATALELGDNEYRMDVAVDEKAQQTARHYLSERGIDRSSDYAVFCPFTTRAQKHWFAERWAALAVELERKLGLPAVVLGGREASDAACTIAENAPSTMVNLVGVTRLAEAIAIISDASMVIGVDTGLTHAAVAKNRPTVALFGSTAPYLDTGYPRAKVLYEALPCSPCRRHPTCGGRFDCMRAHSVEGVLEAARRLLPAMA